MEFSNVASTSGEMSSGSPNAKQGSDSTDGTEDQEEEDSSSSSSTCVEAHSVEHELKEFRENWCRELKTVPLQNEAFKFASGHVPTGVFVQTNQNTFADCNDLKVESCDVHQNIQEMAKELYICGMKAEENGKLYEAIQFYKRAVQIVPDIETQISNMIPTLQHDSVYSESEGSDYSDDDQDYEDEDELDLITRFANLNAKAYRSCYAAYNQRLTHISELPREVLIYIFKWVISSDLDMTSLEHLSLCSRGFYLLARDPELWRLACMKVWGMNCGLPNKFGSWRNMFIERPRLLFNGAYISKTTYIRPGETSFQDQNYRPWYSVEYFRYLRFFPEGTLLMLTTPDEPMAALNKLRQRFSKHQAVLFGHYCLQENFVTAVLKKSTNDPLPILTNNRYRRLRNAQQIQDSGEQTFHVELELKHFKTKLNYKLEWRRYSVHTVYRNGQETVSDFDLAQTKFPPFWFSRVKSYTAESDNPL